MTPAPSLPALRVAYLTAGAAGMFCGSCMQDNTLARALIRQGVDVQLIPTYTPIRTDDENVSVDQVFFGGINVFLQQKIPLLRFVPRFLDRFLDNPRLIRWATVRGIEISPQSLGALAVSMLQGRSGRQRKEVDRLCDWLAAGTSREGGAPPNVVHFTNVLIAASAPVLKQRLDAAVLVTLQGDDIFLEGLPEPYRARALTEIRRLIQHIDGFIIHSRYYAEYMADYLGIPPEKIRLASLGIETADWSDRPEPSRAAARPPTIGYLARLSKEKGLHLLVDAFLELRQRPETRHARLRIAGWLGEHNRDYAEEQFDRLRGAGLEEAFDYAGTVDRAEKVAFLESIDVLSTPTTYREPKGIFVLEALAAGVPVVQPDHGAFPELIAATGGGLLFRAGDSLSLADQLQSLLTDETKRRTLGQQGRAQVRAEFSAQASARRMRGIYEQFVRPPTAKST